MLARKMWTRTLLRLSMSLAAFMAAPAPATAAPRESVLSSYSLEAVDGREIERAARSGDNCVLTLLDDEFVLQLEPVNLRGESLTVSAGSQFHQRRIYLDRPGTYKGTVAGDPESSVRITVTRDGVFGYIRDSAGWVFVEPAPPGSGANAEVHRVYTEQDISRTFLGSCLQSLSPHAHRQSTGSESTGSESTGSETTGSETTGAATTGAATPMVMELAVDADVEYFSIHGGDTVASIEAVVNTVDGILLADFNITIEIVRIQIFESEPDPYTSTDSLALLTELRNHWVANNGSVQRDVVHLFTGRDLDDSTVGRAWVGSVCNTSYGYGLSQELHSLALMSLLVAHEIGHNMGALHDPSDSTPRYIMYPSISFANLDQYSPESITQINSFLSSQSCLSAAGEEDPPPPPSGGGGGGGGGPVDPFLAGSLALFLWWRWRGSRNNRQARQTQASRRCKACP